MHLKLNNEMKKNLLILIAFAALTTAIVIVGCGNAAFAKESSTKAVKLNSKQSDNTDGKSTIFDIFSDGKLFVDFGNTAFSPTRNALIPTLKSNDGHTTVGFVSCSDSNLYDSYKSLFEDFKQNKGYKLEEFTTHGYKAIRVSYFDDAIAPKYITDIFIDFGSAQQAKPHTGIKINVSNDLSAEKCYSAEITKLIESICFAK